MADGEFWNSGGIESIRSGVSRAVKARKTGGAKGLLLGAQIVLKASNATVPHEEGDLERDGGVSVDPDRQIAAISYGRSAQTKDYAVPQHERMDYRHDAGRGPKYLENALNKTRDQVAQVIATQLKREIGTD